MPVRYLNLGMDITNKKLDVKRIEEKIFMAQTKKSKNLRTYFRNKLIPIYIVSGALFIAAVVILMIGILRAQNMFIYIGVSLIVMSDIVLILSIYGQADSYAKKIQEDLIYDVSKSLDTVTSYQRKLEMTKSDIVEVNELKNKFANIISAFKDTRFIDRKIDDTYLNFGYVEGFSDLITTSSFMYNLTYLLKLNSYARGGLILTRIVGGEAFDEVVRELMAKVRDTFATKTYIGKYSEDTIIVYVCDVESISTFKYACNRLFTEFSYSLNNLHEDFVYSCKVGGSIFPYSSINRMLNDAEVAMNSKNDVQINIPNTFMANQGEVQSLDEANRKKIVLTERLSSYLSNFHLDQDPYHQVDEIFSVFSEYSQFETWGIIESFSKSENKANFKCIRESGVDTTRLFKGRDNIDLAEISVLFSARDQNDCFYSTRRDELSPEIGRIFDKHNLNAIFCSFSGIGGEIVGMTYLISSKKNVKLYKDDVQLISQELFFLNYLVLYYLGLQHNTLSKKNLDLLLKYTTNSMYTVNKVTYSLESLSPDLTLQYGKEALGKKCYKTLFGRKEPCDNCPLAKPKNMDEQFKFNGKQYYRKELSESNVTDFASMLLTAANKDKEPVKLYDSATSLLSRYSFEEFVSTAVKEEAKGSLVFIDIQGENQIVRDYGEANLNSMIADIGDSIIDRDISENVYRYDQSTIAIFFMETSRIDTYRIIEEIHKNIYHIYKAGGDIIQLNFKYFEINITNTLKTEHEIYALVNKGIKQVKKIPDNYMCIAGEEVMRIASREDYILYLLEDNFLNKAVEHRMQPIVSLKDNTIVSSELLLRLYDMLREEMLPPYEVVTTATKIQRMGKFDSLNYETALNLYNKYGNNTFNIYNYKGFSINLSSDSLTSNEWLRHLKRFIINNPMPEGYITFEITEKDIKQNLGRIKVWINELYGYKIHWSVDSYSDEFFSIKEIEELGFNTVKTSRKLLLDAMTDPVFKGLFELVTAESKKRGIQLIAQGIETESQLKFVKDIGIDLAQGYLLYKPLKTDELIAAIQVKKEETKAKDKKKDAKISDEETEEDLKKMSRRERRKFEKAKKLKEVELQKNEQVAKSKLNDQKGEKSASAEKTQIKNK